MMYICLSCYQLKQGDERQLDMNICEDCASDMSDSEPAPEHLPDHLFLFEKNHMQQNSSA